MNFFDRILELVNSNEMIYNENEFQIQLHMSRRWPDAFRATAERQGEDYDETWPPATTHVIDEAPDKISNQEEFFDDLKTVLRRLSKGGSLENGEFA